MCCSFLVRRIIVSFNYEKMMHVVIFCDIRSAIVSKHLKFVKRQSQDRYGRFASPSRHEVGSSSRRRTAPSPSHHEVVSSSRRRTTPPPRARSRLHRMTRWRCGWSAAPLLLLYAWWLLLWHAWWLLLLQHTWRRFHPTTPPRTPWATMTNAPTSKRWACLYELVLDFNCLVELLNVHTFISD
jgi:hypothetical protein